VHLSDRVVPVTVELQIRTVAMDFWASLEHKIYYKYRADVPPTLLRELADAAETAASLDAQMNDCTSKPTRSQLLLPSPEARCPADACRTSGL